MMCLALDRACGGDGYNSFCCLGLASQEQIGLVEKLTGNVMTNSAIEKSGVKTFEGKLGINPAFGGSSGIMTGAK